MQIILNCKCLRRWFSSGTSIVLVSNVLAGVGYFCRVNLMQKQIAINGFEMFDGMVLMVIASVLLAIAGVFTSVKLKKGLALSILLVVCLLAQLILLPALEGGVINRTHIET